MKRIMSHVAVETILYTIPGTTPIKIYDVSHYYRPTNEDLSTVTEGVQNFTVNELLIGYKHAKIAKATVHGVAVNDGTLLFAIDTKNEDY